LEATSNEKLVDVRATIVEVALCETFQVFVIRNSRMNRTGVVSRGPCDILQNRHISKTRRAVARHFLSLEGQSDRLYMNARKPEGDTHWHRRHGSVVLELKRTWSNRDLVIVMIRLVPVMFCKLLQRSYVNKGHMSIGE
jgi:hypothetical protein